MRTLLFLFAAGLAQSAGDRSTALLDAARLGDAGEVRRLLDAGVDVNAVNRYEATALFFAAAKGDLEVARLLVERGARVDLRDTFYGMTPLARALMNDHDEVAEYLLGESPGEADELLGAAIGQGKQRLVRAALASDGLTRAAYDEALARASPEMRALVEAAPRPAASAEPWSPSREDLATLAGRYQNETTGGLAEVALEESGLVLRDAGATTAMRPGSAPRAFVLADERAAVFSGRGGMIEALLIAGVTYRPAGETESRTVAPGSPDAVEASPELADTERGAPRPWPAFRGADRSGIADGQGIPLRWAAASGSNVRFRTEIPGLSVASPIVWGDRIYVVTAVSAAGDATFRTGLYGDVAPVEDISEHRWLLLALATADGRVVWEQELHRGVPGTKRHTKSSQANATPVTDGTHVVTVLGSVGRMFCHDTSGRLLWSRELGVLDVGWFYDADYQWGHSASPVIYRDRVILQADVHGESWIAAHSLATGEELWRTPREGEVPTFATPTVYRGATGDEIVTNGTQIRGYDPDTGRLLWHLAPNSEVPVGSPVVTDDLIYVTAGYPPVRPIYAIRPGSRGDLSLGSDESLAWSKDRGGTYIPTPLVYRGHLYTNANNGRLTCYDARTGELVYRARIGGVGGSFVASPIAADGRLYFTNEEGETFVVQAGPEYRLLARNAVEGTVLASPAASDGLLVIRTLSHVYGIAEEPAEAPDSGESG